MTHYEAHLLPDGRRWIAEGHELTAEGFAELLAGRAEQTQERVWAWGTATESALQ